MRYYGPGRASRRDALQELVDVLLAGRRIGAERLGPPVEGRPLGLGDGAEVRVLGVDPDLVEHAGRLALADGTHDQRDAGQLTEVLLLEPLATHAGRDHGHSHCGDLLEVTVQSGPVNRLGPCMAVGGQRVS